MNDDIPEILLRIVHGTQTEREMRTFLQWFHSSDENRDFFFRLKHILSLHIGGQTPDAEEMEASWDRLWEKIKKQSATQPFSPPSFRSKRFIAVARYAGIAAIAVLLIIAVVRIFHKSYDPVLWVEVKTGAKSEPQNINLPDGSVVWLNASSLFRYPEKFDSMQREVFLDGEAYFNVAKNERKRFVVHTDKQQINVSGTDFNVLGYSSDPYTITTLVTGSVKLGVYDDANNLKSEIEMFANQQVCFDKQLHQTVLSQVDTFDATSWINGIYSFRDATLGVIARRLEKIYGVTIIIQDEADREEKYTGKFFSDQTIREIVEVLNFKGQFRLHFYDDTVFFQKRQVK